MAGRIVDAGLSLLDRQLIDVDGRFAGKVDDLGFTVPEEGAPYVTEILAGPGSLSRRVGGRLGSWIESVHARLHPASDPGPAAISWGVVTKVGSAIHLSVPRSALEVDRFEAWVRDHVVDRIPGSAHAPD
jgi:hypothetical protein